MSSGRSSAPRFQLPTWARWLIPCSIAIALVVAVVVFVDANQNDANRATAGNQAEQQAEQREDYTLVQQQQAPQVEALLPHANPLAAATGAVVAFMKNQVAHSFISGPYNSGACHASGGTPARLTFRCTLVADALNYPFDVVVQPGLERVTYCQVVTPPIPSLRVPLSSRCL